MARNTRITMRQIADELKLSRVTVSSVVNDQARQRGISENTIRRVREHLARRGYVPLRSARHLRGLGQEKIGLIHCGHHYAHLNEAFNWLVDSLADTPQRLEIVIVRRDKLVAGVQELIGRGVTTLVWIHRSAHEVEFAEPDIVNYLAHARCVIYNYHFERANDARALSERGIYLVGVERAKALYQLGRRIAERGHRIIAIPEVPRKWAVRRGRHFERAGLRVVYCAPDIPEHAARHEYSESITHNLLDAMAQENVTCASFSDDATAGAVLKRLLELGVKVPQDVSVTGFNGAPLAGALEVPMTTVRVPVAGMVERVLDIVQGRSADRENRFPLEMVERASLGDRPAADAGRNIRIAVRERPETAAANA